MQEALVAHAACRKTAKNRYRKHASLSLICWTVPYTQRTCRLPQHHNRRLSGNYKTYINLLGPTSDHLHAWRTLVGTCCTKNRVMCAGRVHLRGFGHLRPEFSGYRQICVHSSGEGAASMASQGSRQRVSRSTRPNLPCCLSTFFVLRLGTGPLKWCASDSNKPGTT